jgi:hypothetical protein
MCDDADVATMADDIGTADAFTLPSSLPPEERLTKEVRTTDHR